MMESTSTAILTASSQAAIPVTPSLSITAMGAVAGKIVSTVQRGLLGNTNSIDENQRGTKRRSVKIGASCCPSRALGLMAPTPAERAANKA